MRTVSLWVVALAASTLGAACTGTGPEDATTISMDDFVSTYVDLRLSALQTTDSEILPEERVRILTDRGLSEDDLIAFVDAHGRDATFMQIVWDSVEGRFNRASDSLNSIAAELPR